MKIETKDLKEFLNGLIIVEDFGNKEKPRKGRIRSISLDREVLTIIYGGIEEIKNIRQFVRNKKLEILLGLYEYYYYPGDKSIIFNSSYADGKTVTISSSFSQKRNSN